MDYTHELGSLALGARLRRLGEAIGQDIVSIYKQAETGFEARWFPFFQLLAKRSPLSVMEIAEELGVTHPSVIQIIQEMKEKGFIEVVPDKSDKRRLLLSLTRQAERLNNMMVNIWRDLRYATDKLIEDSGSNMLEMLTRLENELKKISLEKRFQEIRQLNSQIEVIIKKYEPILKDDFVNLNKNWIEKYFSLEKSDLKALSDPDKYIIDKGGFIFFAQLGTEIVGTCALQKKSRDTYELAKLRVKEDVQGRGIGRRLIQACLNRAKSVGAKRIVLETNSSLRSTIQLYAKLGFKPVPINRKSSNYERGDFAMQMDLSM